MKYLLIISHLLLLPFVVFSDDVSSDPPSTPDVGNADAQVYFDSLNYNLYYIESSVNALLYDLEQRVESARDQVQQWVDIFMSSAGASVESRAYNEGRADAGTMMFENYIEPMQVSIQSYAFDIREDVAMARRNFTKIAYLWSDNNYSNIIEAIQTNTLVISESINTNQFTVISNLLYIVQTLEAVFPSSTNVTDDVLGDIGDLSSSVRKLVIDFSEFWVSYNNLISFLDSEDENFKKFLDRALERINRPDPKMRTALRDMWDDMLLHRAEILRGWMNTNAASYTPGDQAEVVIHQLSQDFHLSNEGEIALENLAVNQRSYLCLAELVNKQASTNQVADLSWITNYLANVQQPYYDLWNRTFNLSVNIYHPYGTPPNKQYLYLTNFIETASSGHNISATRIAYNTFKNVATNYWERLETYMLMQNGLIGQNSFASPEDEDLIQNNFDNENATRRVDYMTNAFFDVSAQMADSSNIVNRLVAKFKEFNDAFQLPEGDWDQVLRLTPDFSLGEVEVPAIYFSMRDVENISGAVKQVCTCLWYAIFAFLGFRLVLAVFLLLGKAVRSLVLLVATFLN